MTPAARSLLIILAVVFAVAVPSLQAAYQFGMSAAAFSNQGDETLRVAGFAFAIWGLLYLGMIVYALYQALPLARGSELLEIYAWPSFVAITGCGLWILMAALNLIWTTVVVICVSAAALILALIRAKGLGTLADRALIALPLNLLAGWLTIASIVNVVTVLTIVQIVTPDLATVTGLAAIGGATVLAATVALSGRSAFYLAPIIWGLYGARIAESARQPLVADAAGIAVLLLGSLAITMLLMRVISLFSTQRADR
jgi:hypothetical protein